MINCGLQAVAPHACLLGGGAHSAAGGNQASYSADHALLHRSDCLPSITAPVDTSLAPIHAVFQNPNTRYLR